MKIESELQIKITRTPIPDSKLNWKIALWIYRGLNWWVVAVVPSQRTLP